MLSSYFSQSPAPFLKVGLKGSIHEAAPWRSRWLPKPFESDEDVFTGLRSRRSVVCIPSLALRSSLVDNGGMLVTGSYRYGHKPIYLLTNPVYHPPSSLFTFPSNPTPTCPLTLIPPSTTSCRHSPHNQATPTSTSQTLPSSPPTP